VFRGAYGTANSILVKDLVVGDIIQLGQGDRVPADCIVLDEIHLTIDQSIYSRKDTDKNVKKGES
jgi:magnesium-transporting ATPase (P-type)